MFHLNFYTMKKGLFLLPFAAAMLIFTGCDFQGTENVPENDTEILTVAEMEVDALKSLESTEEEISAARFAVQFTPPPGGKLTIPRHFLGPRFPECAEVTVEGDAFPKVVTIVYGDDCVTRGGVQKTGTIIVTVSDSVHLPGASYTVEFIDMTVGNRVRNRTATYTNEGVNDNGNQVISFSMTTSIMVRDSIIIEREAEYSREWLSGFRTPEIGDDSFLLSGSSSLTVKGDTKFSTLITDPLLYDRACRFILSGTVEITRNDATLYIDFGDGECDNIAVVTKDGESAEIELISGRFREEFKRRNRNYNRENGWW